jgi:hypothetical protein
MTSDEMDILFREVALNDEKAHDRAGSQLET